MKITFVTGNANKLREVQAILSKDGGLENIEVVNAALDLEEVQGSIDQVTIHKAKQAAQLVGGPVFVEDTCLAFNALGDLPGPYIKWFVKAIGNEGLLKMLSGFEDKSARAITTFGYCGGPECEPELFQGITTGTIVASRGPEGFGWDPTFMPDGFTTTYAEMKGEAKNAISQRSKALAKLKVFFATLPKDQ